jgi:polyhydroxyalkanoate synthase
MADQQGTPPQSPDRRCFPQTWADIAERSQHIVNEWLSRNGFADARATAAGSFDLATLFVELASQIITIPATMVSAQMSLWQDYFALWQSTTSRMLGHEAELSPTSPGKPYAECLKEVDIFGYIKQSYLLAARCVRELVCNGRASEATMRDTLDFYARQYAAALSPANFALTNPEVIRATIETSGESLIGGLKNLLTELEAVRRSTMSQGGADLRFVVGQTIAATPGKLIFRNELIELIQYEPSRQRVLKRPLLFVPAWLNKYYILDLGERNSLVRWAVDQGHTVFMISWVNPKDAAACKSFADYLLQGPVQALDVIEQAIGETEINAVGHGLGGTLLAATLAYLAESGDDRVKTGTFVTSMVDFSHPGELGSMMDEATLCQLEDARSDSEAHELTRTSNVYRENDLIWSFVVNNYLLGKDPFPFDLLHWNWDSPRFPHGIHKFYLHELYRRNRLVEPDGVVVAGRRVDLRKVKTPIYVLSTREDHIAPWQSTYRALRIFPGASRFTLAASGHLTGVVNPPVANKYCYWTNPKTPQSPEEWRAGARPVEGSWWRDWDAWVKRLSEGDEVTAREPGDGKLKPLGDAPGSYVMADA